MTTREQIMDWLDANPTRDSGTWDGWSGSMGYRLSAALGQPSRAYPLVDMAYAAATIEGMDYRAAPVGAFHYFTHSHTYDPNGTYPGHIMVGLSKNLFLTTGAQVKWLLGNGIGVTTWTHFNQRTQYTYRGWSRYYGETP